MQYASSVIKYFWNKRVSQNSKNNMIWHYKFKLKGKYKSEIKQYTKIIFKKFITYDVFI